jgi:fibronectin-binding autotransporter adhesin
LTEKRIRGSGPARAIGPGYRRLAAGALLLALGASAAGAAPARTAAGPTLTSSPTVTGTATQGSRLTATPGSWHGSGAIKYVFRWYRCDTMGGRCHPLRGASAPRRTPGPGDVGHTLAFAVRATDSTGSTNGYASLIGPIAGSSTRLASVAQPRVSGTAAVGGTVHADTGKWRPAPKSFSYQWIRCNANGRSCAPIRGDNHDSHAIVRRDVAHSLVAIVQAQARGTSRAVFSRATPRIALPETTPGGGNPPPPPAGAGPAASVAPSVTAAVQVGKQLTGAPGTWTGAGTISYAYQWYRCDAAGAHCKSIHGATKATYTQVTKDAANTVGLTVRASDSKGTTSAYASVVGPVAAAGSALYSTAVPAISGTAAIGQALQVSTGSWSQTPTAFTYQWQRCNANGRVCAAIPGATAAGYTVTATDGGHALVAVVRGTVGSSSQSAWSIAAHVAPAATGPTASVRPIVAGVVQQGKQLTGSQGTWTGSGTIQYAYNWYRCDAAGAHCKSIHGATKPTYTQVPKDVGATIGFSVRATDATGTNTAYASLVGPVAAASSPLYSTVQPTITGTPAAGQALQVGAGSWSQTPSAYGYRWLRCNANGRLCATIAGANAAAYTVTAADSGHALVAVVQATAGAVTQPIVSVGVVAA